MVALREPFPIHLDTRTDVVTMHRDANRDLGLDMEPRGGMPLPLMLLELVVLMQGDDTGREHGMYPGPPPHSLYHGGSIGLLVYNHHSASYPSHWTEGDS